MDYAARNRWNVARCNWGEMFGLHPSDLTDEQLRKIQINKLIEMLYDDSRIEKIISEKIHTCPIKDIRSLKYLGRIEREAFPKLISEYNNIINSREKDIEGEDRSSYSSNRSEYVRWDLLSDTNKALEFNRYLSDKKHIISPRHIDFNWLCSKYDWLANRVIEKILSVTYGNHRFSSGDVVPRMIANLPEEFLIKYLDLIFNRCGKHVFSYVLSNPHTPEKYIIKGLRIIAGKIRIPNITMSLNKRMLLALPSVARLQVLETLMVHTYSKIKFDDISKAEDLEPLLFGTAIKYNDRVKQVLNVFRRRYENTGV